MRWGGIIVGEFLGIKLRCDKFVLLSQAIAGDPFDVCFTVCNLFGGRSAAHNLFGVHVDIHNLFRVRFTVRNLLGRSAVRNLLLVRALLVSFWDLGFCFLPQIAV